MQQNWKSLYMVTLVGMQDDFGKALCDLVELEYDAVEAYDAAINRLDNQEYKNQLTSFKEDHVRHISDLSEHLKKHDIDPPSGPSMGKQWLTKGKVVLGNLAGDITILRAMRSNKVDTNVAYEWLRAHDHIWSESQTLIENNYQDEQKHKKWLERIIEKEGVFSQKLGS